MVAASARGRLATDVSSELLVKELLRSREVRFPCSAIRISAQPRIWKVINEAAEDKLTVSPVLRGVEQVRVPHLIEQSRRDQGRIGEEHRRHRRDQRRRFP